MKVNNLILGLMISVTLLASSCKKDDATVEAVKVLPTAQAFATLKGEADKLVSSTKTFVAADGVVFTSAKGVVLTLAPNALRLANGDTAKGTVTLEYKEIFDRGAMLTNNRPTMGKLSDGSKGLLISGGEFFINAKLGDQQLTLATTAKLQIPIPATEVGNATMTLWTGAVDKDDNLTWNEIKTDNTGGNGGRVVLDGKGDAQSYYVGLSGFGWTNVDRFYSDPRPKTTLLAAVPTGYDNHNCSIYLSYDGEGTHALANLDTYSAVTKMFSEHYGQIPIGLQMHVIFVTEDAGQWRYAIKAVTVAANDTYTFTLAETTLASLAAVEAAVNALP